MPFDVVVTSPPFAPRHESQPATAAPFRSWQAPVASFWDVVRPTHVVIEHRGLLFILPRRLLTILAGHPPTCGQDEPLPEAFVVGSGADYEEVVHEPVAAARLFELSEAFATLRVPDRSSVVANLFAGGGPFAGSVYRCFYGAAAEKLGRCLIEGAAGEQSRTAEWVPPLRQVSPNEKDGGQDGLLCIDGRHFWLQVTGGEKPGILPSAKSPVSVAKDSFVPEGETQMRSGSVERRRRLYGGRMPARADMLNLVVAKVAPAGPTQRCAGGIVWERRAIGTTERRFLQTITVHPVLLSNPSYPVVMGNPPYSQRSSTKGVEHT